MAPFKLLRLAGYESVGFKKVRTVRLSCRSWPGPWEGQILTRMNTKSCGVRFPTKIQNIHSEMAAKVDQLHVKTLLIQEWVEGDGFMLEIRPGAVTERAKELFEPSTQECPAARD